MIKNYTFRQVANCLAILLFMVTVVGCGEGSSGPSLVPVSGTLSLDGKPLANADLQFSTTNEGEAAASFGTTDQEGHFDLKSQDGKEGATPGGHRVNITVMPAGSGGPTKTEGGEEVLSMQGEPKEYYLEVTVGAEGESDLKLEVKK
ncbi:MAG: hypothetical protein ACKVH8_19045 [Pirellulales bacterium]